MLKTSGRLPFHRVASASGTSRPACIGTNAEPSSVTTGAFGYHPGARAGGAKLDDEKVRAIRKAYATGRLQREIAAEFGVTKENVSCIVRRKTWQHVSDEPEAADDAD